MPAFPEIRVGDPARHEALAVFPLYGPGNSAVEYLLSDEALAAGSVTVEETSEAGSVPTLVVTNQADQERAEGAAASPSPAAMMNREQVAGLPLPPAARSKGEQEATSLPKALSCFFQNLSGIAARKRSQP
jgi:hypothetical protein